jgi:DNA-binding transcriptional LysR family regulator
MNLIQLEYVIEVAKTHSISKAAENLHVSVATISLAISNLESYYGVKLFKRSRSGTEPTPEGAYIIKKAKEIKEIVQDMESNICHTNSALDKPLTIATTLSILNGLLPKTVKYLMEKFLDVKVKIKVSSVEDIIVETVLNHETDLGFVSTNRFTWDKLCKRFKSSLKFEPLSYGQMYLCTNQSSPFARRKEVYLKDLIGQSMVVYPHCKPAFESVVKYGPAHLMLETDNAEVIKKMVREGIGVTFFSDFFIWDDLSLYHDDGLALIPIIDPLADLVFGIVRSRKRNLSDPARELMNIARKLSNHQPMARIQMRSQLAQ